MGALVWMKKKRKRNADFHWKREKNGCWMLWILSLSLEDEKAIKEEWG